MSRRRFLSPPPQLSHNLELIGLSFEGYTTLGPTETKRDTNIMISPLTNDLTKKTVIEYPETTYTILDKDYVEDNAGGSSSGGPCNFNHLIYCRWTNPYGSDSIFEYQMMWNQHPPKSMEYGMMYRDYWLSQVKLMIVSGVIIFKSENLKYAFKQNGASINIVSSMLDYSYGTLVYDISEYNDLDAKGDTIPLLVNKTSVDIKIAYSSTSMTIYNTLKPGESFKIKYLLDVSSGIFVNCKILAAT